MLVTEPIRRRPAVTARRARALWKGGAARAGPARHVRAGPVRGAGGGGAAGDGGAAAGILLQGTCACNRGRVHVTGDVCM